MNDGVIRFLWNKNSKQVSWIAIIYVKFQDKISQQYFKQISLTN